MEKDDLWKMASDIMPLITILDVFVEKDNNPIDIKVIGIATLLCKRINEVDNNEQKRHLAGAVIKKLGDSYFHDVMSKSDEL